MTEVVFNWSPGRGPDETNRRLDVMRGAVLRRMHTAFEQVGNEWLRQMTASLVANRYSRGGGPRALAGNRSGTLSDSLGTVVDPPMFLLQNRPRGEMLDLALRFRSDMPARFNYTLSLEHGATITPKHRKYLTIPLDAALTSSGLLKRSPRAYTDSFVFKSKRGNLFIARSQERVSKGTARGLGLGTGVTAKATKAKLELLFLLVKSSKIPPGKLRFRLTAAEVVSSGYAKEKFTDALAKAVLDAKRAKL